MADPNDWWNPTRPLSPEWYAAPQRTEPPQRNILARAMAGVQDLPANVWGSLTPEVRSSWGSLANAIAEMSPGASVRDMVNSSGDLTRNVLAGNTWGSLGAGAGLLTAMAGLVPGEKLAGKVAGKVAATGMAEKAATEAASDVLPRIGAEGRVAGPYIPEKAARSLRDRYGVLLWEASGGKDANRIKLTDERMEKAKELLAERQAIRTQFMGRSPRETTQQMRDAVTFAEEAVRNGYDTRFKVPDGPYGSLYVKAGDNMVRFADHPQPMEGGKVVGGYSSTLGRRHYPADMSVSPNENSLSDALALLRKYGLAGLGGSVLGYNALAPQWPQGDER